MQHGTSNQVHAFMGKWVSNLGASENGEFPPKWSFFVGDVMTDIWMEPDFSPNMRHSLWPPMNLSRSAKLKPLVIHPGHCAGESQRSKFIWPVYRGSIWIWLIRNQQIATQSCHSNGKNDESFRTGISHNVSDRSLTCWVSYCAQRVSNSPSAAQESCRTKMEWFTKSPVIIGVVI